MEFLKTALDDLKAANNYRKMVVIGSAQRPRVLVDGREYIMLASSSYLGLNIHPKLIHATQLSAHEYGVCSSGSRLITGTLKIHIDLESKLSQFLGTEDTILFNSGYDANIGVIPAVMNQGDMIFSDELNHASINDGCQLSKAKLCVYKHNDMADLESELKKVSGSGNKSSNKLIITDTVFSMDGNLANLVELTELAVKYDASVMVDEAHAVGVFGDHGRGVCEYLDVEDRIDIKMGAFSKALGSAGGYIAGGSELVDFLRNKARSFIYTTSLPPTVLSSARAALEIVSTDPGKMLRKQLWDNVGLYPQGLDLNGYDTMSSSSQIIPIMMGSAEHTLQASQFLFDQGVFVTGIRPPTVPPNRCRLRTTVLANHSREDIDDVLRIFSGMNEDLKLNV